MAITMATRGRTSHKVRWLIHVNPESVERYHLMEVPDQFSPVGGHVGMSEVRVDRLVGPHLHTHTQSHLMMYTMTHDLSNDWQPRRVLDEDVHSHSVVIGRVVSLCVADPRILCVCVCVWGGGLEH